MLIDLQKGYENWEGAASELADTANEVARQLGLELGDSSYNERLIRSYVQLDAIDRPERRGKEAYFGFRQLVQCLAVRVLLNDGWPLAKIAEFIQLNALDKLVDLLPKPGTLTQAQQLIGKFRSDRQSRATSLFSMASPSTVPPSAMEQAVSLSRRRQTNQSYRESQPTSATRDESSLCVRLDVWPGCQVYVDRDFLRQMSHEQADLLGQALSHALIDMRLTYNKGDRK